MPLIKTGAKALGNIALKSGTDFVGDVLAGRNVKEAAKARTVEAGNVAKRKAIRNPSLRKDNLLNGLVPKTFVFGLVESEVFNGALKKNRYNFQHFNVSSIGITVNGEEMPFKPLQLSYGAAAKYIEAFSTLFSGTGKMYHNTGNDISRDEFPKGNAVYAYDLTPDMCGASPHFNVVQTGNLAIDIQFSVAPAAAVSLVCYGEFENTVHIDSERNVVYDYSG
ncbi:Hypothetical predicted protein [Paramuricea clavata]|uniref:Uncharacterized protein n=1 Tax=Paramuricea clavata TaxID=317549 RepID=A0A6S7HIK7_PARCT|nr:Hypothetical predicted protein [Paramuricea clavata]